MTVFARVQGVTPLLASWDKGKGGSLTEYLPYHIIVLKNPTEQVGTDARQRGDEPVLLADPLGHENINIPLLYLTFHRN